MNVKSGAAVKGQPASKSNGGNVSDGAGGNQQYVRRINNDAREDEMEENMQAVGGILGNLKNMATDMGAEIEKQNTQLDRINDKVNYLDFLLILKLHLIRSAGHFRRFYFNLCAYLGFMNKRFLSLKDLADFFSFDLDFMFLLFITYRVETLVYESILQIREQKPYSKNNGIRINHYLWKTSEKITSHIIPNEKTIT